MIVPRQQQLDNSIMMLLSCHAGHLPLFYGCGRSERSGGRALPICAIHSFASWTHPSLTVCCSSCCRLLRSGVTRASIIELARSRGYEVLEEKVAVTEAMEVRGAVA
jgi:hypothetical protein